MAINPDLIETRKISQLPDLALALGNFIAHCGADGIAGKVDIEALANFIAPYVSALGSSPFVANTGSPLPNPIEKPTAITFVGVGTFDQTTGSDVVTTEELNVLFWSSLDGITGTWVIGVEIPINLTDYVLKSDIVNNLTTDDATRPLSAAQGKIFGDMLVASPNLIDKSKFTSGVYSPNTGVVSPSNNWIHSTKMDIPVGTDFILSHHGTVPMASALVLFWNASDVYINSPILGQGSGVTTTAISSSSFPVGATKWAFNVANLTNIGLTPTNNAIANAVNLNLGTVELPYKSFGYTISQNSINGNLNKINGWVAQSYEAGKQVNYVGNIYESVTSVLSTDIPGTAPITKWKPVINIPNTIIRNDFSSFLDSRVSSYDLPSTYELLNVGDAIEFEVRITDNSVSNFGIAGTKNVAASNWIGIDNTGRFRIRESNGTQANGVYIYPLRLNKIKLEVITDFYKLTLNNSHVSLIAKTDKITITNIGRAYSATSFNGLLRNLKIYVAGVLSLDAPEITNKIGIVGVLSEKPTVDDYVSIMASYSWLLTYGQSNGLGTSQSTSAIFSKELYNNATFKGGVRAGTAADGTLDGLTAIKALIEERSSTETLRGESHMSSMANYATYTTKEKFPISYYKFFASSPGKGGTSLVSLSKPSDAYTWYLDQLTALKSLTPFDPTVIYAFIWIGGEADYTSTSGSTTYYSRLKVLLDDMTTDYQSIFGNINFPKMYSYQVAAHKYYQYRPVTPNPAAAVPYIALQQKKAADTYSDIKITYPAHILDYVDDVIEDITYEDANLHFTPESHNLQGAYHWKAILIDNVPLSLSGQIPSELIYNIPLNSVKGWRPLEPTLVKKLDNRTINIKFNVPGDYLVFDDVNDGGIITPILDKGFEVWTDSGRQTISTVEIVSSDTVRITLVTDITGTNPFVCANYGSDITEIKMGRKFGPRSQLRDNQGDYFKWRIQNGELFDLHNFCLTFKETIV